jgi:hypothetical protein
MQPFLSATGGAGLPAHGEQSGGRAKAYHHGVLLQTRWLVTGQGVARRRLGHISAAPGRTVTTGVEGGAAKVRVVPCLYDGRTMRDGRWFGVAGGGRTKKRPGGREHRASHTRGSYRIGGTSCAIGRRRSLSHRSRNPGQRGQQSLLLLQLPRAACRDYETETRGCTRRGVGSACGNMPTRLGNRNPKSIAIGARLRL